MSWEYTKYKAKCLDCGNEGICIQGEDDWFRQSTRWEGFKNVEPDATAVGRKRSDSRDKRPFCMCGSMNIEVGDIILE